MWLRLRQIAVMTGDLRPVVDDLRALLGLEVCYRDPEVEVFGLENALLPVGNQFLEVLSPIREGTAGGRLLERRAGDGGYMVITQCDDLTPRRQRVDVLGVRVAHEFEVPGTFRNMQLHPRDTGGSFLEIDQQLGPGADQEDGPWHPAGSGGQAAGRSGAAYAVTAAEVQGDDPERLAARWGEIVELPVEPDAGGRPSLRLRDAVVRFVEATDGRGEGLGGIDVAVADPEGVRAAAGARGCLAGDQVVVGGVRIGLTA